MIYIRILFVALVLFELRYKKFKSTQELIFWVALVGIFSWFGYIIFLLFRKRILVRRDRFNLELKKPKENQLE
ncbi:hypothetical protein ACFSYG_16615 [Leeuwenhoekiella polynyae]|uniref:hypothetical protein n=1 Tax=Leeuwenhoekiella polynyae TaxID=1550906 RepID=UPI000FFE86AE|nr:hypothetical protein [Leeuwenhoekiella polynyae]